jgi:hypothetical protein
MDDKTQNLPAVESQPGKKWSFWDSAFIDVAGIGATVVSGIAAGIYSVRTNFFKNAHKYELFQHEMGKRDNARGELHTSNSVLVGEKLISKIEEIETSYDKAKTATLKKTGLDSIQRQWRSLRKHQKWEAGLSFAVGATVALGIAGTIISSLHVNKKQKELEKRLDEINSRHNAQG